MVQHVDLDIYHGFDGQLIVMQIAKT